MSQLYTQKYPANAIANQGNDWLSTSGDKIQDVADADDSDYIYVRSGSIPQKLYVMLQLGTSQQISQVFDLPEEPSKLTILFLKPLAPDNAAWTIQKWNDMFAIVADSTHTYYQSFTFEQEEVSTQVTNGGVELICNFGTDGLDDIRIKGLEIKKVRQWLG